MDSIIYNFGIALYVKNDVVYISSREIAKLLEITHMEAFKIIEDKENEWNSGHQDKIIRLDSIIDPEGHEINEPVFMLTKQQVLFVFKRNFLMSYLINLLIRDRLWGEKVKPVINKVITLEDVRFALEFHDVKNFVVIEFLVEMGVLEPINMYSVDLQVTPRYQKTCKIYGMGEVIFTLDFFKELNKRMEEIKKRTSEIY